MNNKREAFGSLFLFGYMCLGGSTIVSSMPISSMRDAMVADICESVMM